MCLFVCKGLRVDGRRPHELRKVKCQLGVFQQADGSAFLEQGNTKVFATVYGPHDVSVTVVTNVGQRYALTRKGCSGKAAG